MCGKWLYDPGRDQGWLCTIISIIIIMSIVTGFYAILYKHHLCYYNGRRGIMSVKPLSSNYKVKAKVQKALDRASEAGNQQIWACLSLPGVQIEFSTISQMIHSSNFFIFQDLSYSTPCKMGSSGNALASNSELNHQKYNLRWHDYPQSVVTSFRHLKEDEDFVDVTLACNSQQFTAHKVVLSACSPYFKKLLKVR